MQEYKHPQPVNNASRAYNPPAVAQEVDPLSTMFAICPNVMQGHQHVTQQLEQSEKQPQRPDDQDPAGGAGAVAGN